MSSRFQLGQEASNHIKHVTIVAKVCVVEYREFLKETDSLQNEEASGLGFLIAGLKSVADDANMIARDQFVAKGDELVE